MTDELNDPLGHGVSQRPPPSLAARRLYAGAILVALVALGFSLFPRDPYGGEPYAIARIEPPQSAPPPAAATAKDAPPGREPIATASEFEQFSGVKVTRNGGGIEAGGARIIRIEPSTGVRLAPAPDRRVVEKGQYGPLPKIGADGARPMDIYARPFVTGPTLKPDAPRVAIIVGGVGLNPQASQAAIEQLPEGVTLAFAPYGADIDRLVAQARAQGHEALLQAPMEPFDYPQNNPGPHTLLAGAPDGGLNDLRWLMSRFSGYAGVMNYLGGRFTSDAAALTPALAEIAQRGLFFLDDGASPQSLATTLAPKLSLPHAKVDIVLDARGAQQALDAALAQLEAQARANGVAIGFANALPATISRLARFARDLERRGVALAPVSAALAPKTASADARGGTRP